MKNWASLSYTDFDFCQRWKLYNGSQSLKWYWDDGRNRWNKWSSKMDLFSASFYLFLMKKMKYYSWYLTKSAKMALSKHFLVNEPKSFERSHYVTKSSKIMRKLFKSHFQHRINFSYNTQFSCCELQNFSNHNNDKKYQIDSYENLV